jgi:hypothetical protein
MGIMAFGVYGDCGGGDVSVLVRYC